MKQFWALIHTDQELTNSDQVQKICNEISDKVSHVTTVSPAPEDTYAGE